MNKEFYSNGKLLISGEYLVLDGAFGFALPTSYGQSLVVEEIERNQLHWISKDEKDITWFETTIDLKAFRSHPEKLHLDMAFQEETNTLKTLVQILTTAQKLNSKFLNTDHGYQVTTTLSFPRNWGLGSSSTLINNIAQWAQIDAYSLLWGAFSGSGYDIAAAQNNHPILYQLKDQKPAIQKVVFKPLFAKHLYFVHLNKKQNSRTGIIQYRKQNFDLKATTKKINAVTKDILVSKTLSDFSILIEKHEVLLSAILGISTVKKTLFPDYKGSIKSLGAWGGDFILAAGDEQTPAYFKEKGFHTVLPYHKMIL